MSELDIFRSIKNAVENENKNNDLSDVFMLYLKAFKTKKPSAGTLAYLASGNFFPSVLSRTKKLMQNKDKPTDVFLLVGLIRDVTLFYPLVFLCVDLIGANGLGFLIRSLFMLEFELMEFGGKAYASELPIVLNRYASELTLILSAFTTSWKGQESLQQVLEDLNLSECTRVLWKYYHRSACPKNEAMVSYFTTLLCFSWIFMFKSSPSSEPFLENLLHLHSSVMLDIFTSSAGVFMEKQIHTFENYELDLCTSLAKQEEHIRPFLAPPPKEKSSAWIRSLHSCTESLAFELLDKRWESFISSHPKLFLDFVTNSFLCIFRAELHKFWMNCEKRENNRTQKLSSTTHPMTTILDKNENKNKNKNKMKQNNKQEQKQKEEEESKEDCELNPRALFFSSLLPWLSFHSKLRGWLHYSTNPIVSTILKHSRYVFLLLPFESEALSTFRSSGIRMMAENVQINSQVSKCCYSKCVGGVATFIQNSKDSQRLRVLDETQNMKNIIRTSNGQLPDSPSQCLLLCQGCAITRYCCLSCQRNDWSFHKSWCRATKDVRTRYEKNQGAQINK